ncbi:MAG: hypothetical protein HeimC3_18230 [Candidatus Heimdallarchaeota archaeon LC_3]|nr:MAG: hypothetical protein HeimC3_18230 [Candidatus Heimdallarchaeota archaeon LC_3]
MSEIRTPEQFMLEYEKKTNSFNFENVIPLIAEEAVYWFTDGSFTGLNEIRSAFEETWRTIEKDKFTILNINWIT